MNGQTFTFHTPTETLASFSTVSDAVEYAANLKTFQGVAVTMPQGGEINSHMFLVWGRQGIRRGILK